MGALVAVDCCPWTRGYVSMRLLSFTRFAPMISRLHGYTIVKREYRVLRGTNATDVKLDVFTA